MIQLITERCYGEFTEALIAMHQLRYRVFKERLDWDVHTSGDMEVDSFDALHPAYLVQLATDGRIQGCVRLLPSVGPTMLRDAFPALLAGQSAPSNCSIWESSRFALDVATDAPKGKHSIACATYELFAAMIEFDGIRENTAEKTDGACCGTGATANNGFSAQLFSPDRNPRLSSHDVLQHLVDVSLCEVFNAPRAYERNDVTFNAACVGDDRRRLLGTTAFPQNTAGLQIVEIEGAEFLTVVALWSSWRSWAGLSPCATRLNWTFASCRAVSGVQTP